MMRLLGILLGSAIAVAILILVAGIPQLTDERQPEPVDVQLPLLPEPVAVVEATPPPPDPIVTAPPLPGPEPETEVAAPVEPEQAAAPQPLQLPATPASVEQLHWYAFWSPFRSQIAANGFVAQLQRVTALDYRVVSVKPGVYEVAFAYTDDADIQTNLSQIAAATGLDVPET